MSYSGNNMGASSTTASINRTSGPTLYQNERCGGTFPYQFNVPNGRYAVTLIFADIYLTQTGRRVFNVAVNGQNALTNFDIIQAAGANAAIDQTFNVFGHWRPGYDSVHDCRGQRQDQRHPDPMIWMARQATKF